MCFLIVGKITPDNPLGFLDFHLLFSYKKFNNGCNFCLICICKVFLFVFDSICMSVSKTVAAPLSNDKVARKGSGIQLIFGVLVLIVSLWIMLFTTLGIFLYVLLPVGAILIVSSFLIIINQYDRAIILRLGIYKKTVKPGVHTRIPL